MMRKSSRSRRKQPARKTIPQPADIPPEDIPANAPDAPLEEAAPDHEPPPEEAAPDHEPPTEDIPANTPEGPAAIPLPDRIPHPLWRGWWLSVCLLTIAVLMGQVEAVGLAWVHQPLRAFGGAVAAGGFLAALTGFVKGQLPERPSLRRCLLGLLCGLAWGVLG